MRQPVQGARDRDLGDLGGLLREKFTAVGGELRGDLRRDGAGGETESDVEFTDQGSGEGCIEGSIGDCIR